MRIATTALGAVMLAFGATSGAAEVIEDSEANFVTRSVAVVDADRTAVWLALISPSRWWSSDHTWSGDASNLTLMPQAGGCFCERIPEVDEPDRFTLEGSVEHMRVIQAYPEVALRMSGALGPLQSEPVTGILTITISLVEEGTQIVFEYNVGGQMRYEAPQIARAVDAVLTLQLTRLAQELGAVELPAPPTGSSAEADDGSGSDGEGAQADAAQPEAGDGIAIDPEDVLDEGPDAPDAPGNTPSVDEAFGDLSGPGD